MSQPPPEGARRTTQAGDTALSGAPLVLLENDLFFLVKVRDTLTTAGYTVLTARRLAELERLLAPELTHDQERGTLPALLLVNAAARGIDWRAAITLARGHDIPVIVYAPHVDLETQAEARAAGATRVIANSKLATDLAGLVARTVRPTLSRPDVRGVPGSHDMAAAPEASDAAVSEADRTSEIAAKSAKSATLAEHESEIAAKSAIPAPSGASITSLETAIPAKTASSTTPLSRRAGEGSGEVPNNEIAAKTATAPESMRTAPITPPHDGAQEQRGSRREAMDPPATAAREP